MLSIRTHRQTLRKNLHRCSREYVEPQQRLINRLDPMHTESEEIALPDELIVMVFEHLLLEARQPVIVDPRNLEGLREHSADPCHQMLQQVFERYNISTHLSALARQTYFKINTIHINAPEERSPRQILRSPLFTAAWTKDICALELNLTFTAEVINSLCYHGQTMQFRGVSKIMLEPRDAMRVVTVLEYLKLSFLRLRLRRLTLMLSVKSGANPSWYCHGCGSGLMKRLRGTELTGQLCCLLAVEQSNVCAVFEETLVSALLRLDLNYAAFKWKTDCGHKQCREWLDQKAEVFDGRWKLIRGHEDTAVVLKERKMAPWA